MPVTTGNGRRPLPVLWANPVMGSWWHRYPHFPVHCRSVALHNEAPVRPRQLGQRWPVTNGDEHVGDLLLGIEDAGTSAQRAKRAVPRRLCSGARAAEL